MFMAQFKWDKKNDNDIRVVFLVISKVCCHADLTMFLMSTHQTA